VALNGNLIDIEFPDNLVTCKILQVSDPELHAF
jgi:hypothetical protein